MTREERPWGWFEPMGDGPGYLVKRLLIRAGQRISLQRHHHRDEHWVVVAGSGWLELESCRQACAVGSTFQVPRGSLQLGLRRSRGSADRRSATRINTAGRRHRTGL